MQQLPKAENAQAYLDTALKRGGQKAASVKRISNALSRVKAKEKDRMREIRDSLVKSLTKLHDAYPSFDELGEFTKRTFELDLEIGRVKQAIGGLQHARTTIKALTLEYLKKISSASKTSEVISARRSYLGRIASVLRKTNFSVLNDARDVSRAMPTVDDDLFTVAIAGFPNVGKSTLLRRITTAKPLIKPYAFTTKGLNVGYFEYKYNKIQCIDTPGTLNRRKMNSTEKKASIAIRYLADMIVYVFDPTESSYPLSKQMKLYEILKSETPVIVYISKTDMADEKDVASLREKFPECLTEPEKLKKVLVENFKEWL